MNQFSKTFITSNELWVFYNHMQSYERNKLQTKPDPDCNKRVNFQSPKPIFICKASFTDVSILAWQLCTLEEYLLWIWKRLKKYVLCKEFYAQGINNLLVQWKQLIWLNLKLIIRYKSIIFLIKNTLGFSLQLNSISEKNLIYTVQWTEQNSHRLFRRIKWLRNHFESKVVHVFLEIVYEKIFKIYIDDRENFINLFSTDA